MEQKLSALALVLVAILTCLLSGCGSNLQSANGQSGSDKAGGEIDSASNGSTATFTQGNLVLEITNVCDVRTETKLDDGSVPYEQTIYTCYPGATLSVVKADMSDPAYTEDGNPHAQWALYDISTDTRTELTDNTEPIVVNDNTSVINLESSLCMLVFEFTK